MKKLLAVLMVSISFFVAQAGYTQSLYAGGNYGSIELGTETDVGADNSIVKKWIFRGIRYVSYLLMLKDVWDVLNELIADGGGRNDPRAVDVCEFYYKYKDDYDLSSMGEKLKEHRLCSRRCKGQP